MRLMLYIFGMTMISGILSKKKDPSKKQKERQRYVRLVAAVILSMLLNISIVSAMPSDDSYIAGYASAILEREFHLTPDALRVHNGIISVSSSGLDTVQRDSLSRELSGIKGVVSVEFTVPTEKTGDPESVKPPPSTPKASRTAKEGQMPENPVLLPKGRLFDPLMADPRWAHFSIAYHYYLNNKELRSVGSTSFGEFLSLFRDDFPLGGEWQVGVQAGVFAIFDLDSDSMDLINADYWVGIPVTYRNNKFSSLFRVFHQSSHLGDEFLLRNNPERVNLSYESVDAKVSYDITDWLRLYGGAGYIFHREPMDLKPWSTQFGTELKSPSKFLGGVARPVAGVDIKNWEENKWSTDISIRFGLQLESAKTESHTFQILIEYFRGHSPNGQFYEKPIEYMGIGTHFYF